jgi:hypothetical protein
MAWKKMWVPRGGKRYQQSATPVSKVVTILLVRAFLPLKIGQE